VRLRTRLVGTVLAGLLLLPASAAWASGDESEFAPAQRVPPKEWSDDVCTAFADWSDALDDSEKYLESDLKKPASLSEVRAALVDFIAEAVEDTDVALADIHDAGVPKMKNGDKLAQVFESAITEVRMVLGEAQASVAQVSETDPAQFEAFASDFEKTAKAMERDFERTIKRAERRYKSPTLHDPACNP
jgi:hypothetical protein